MIFVTVGTHEQPFNRLVQCIDEMKKNNEIQDEVIIQTGFSTYEPRYCKWSKLFTYKQMAKNVQEARIVITHGGPSSFIAPFQIGKIPIVMPRQKRFGEHVNDHQVEFAKAVSVRHGNIIVAEDVQQVRNVILNYDEIVKSMSIELKSNNQIFNTELEKIVEELLVK